MKFTQNIWFQLVLQCFSSSLLMMEINPIYAKNVIKIQDVIISKEVVTAFWGRSSVRALYPTLVPQL